MTSAVPANARNAVRNELELWSSSSSGSLLGVGKTPLEEFGVEVLPEGKGMKTMFAISKSICLSVLFAALFVTTGALAADRADSRDAAAVTQTRLTTVAAAGSAQSVLRARADALNASCIESGQTCTLHGTPCCGAYTCKGKFPNTTCQ
jgi:hypothetical protein